MGIGNTTTSSAVFSVLQQLPPEQVTGRGAGLSGAGLRHKVEVIAKAIALHQPDRNDVLDVLSKVGGLDICGMAGAFLGGAVYHVPVLIDGFISAVAANCAVRLAPLCRQYLFASHCSKEPAGKLALEALGLRAYLDCDMCLGEGTGGVIGAKLFDFALAAYGEIAGFDAWESLPMKNYNRQYRINHSGKGEMYMKYQTTNLQPTKRYPTYQFHARTAQKKLPAEQVFCICVLETLHWLRSRLKKFSCLPEDICTPEPAQYEAFSMQQLHSFHSSVGAAVDVIYLENRGLWSFQITEPDIGANLGTPQERPAVSGRIFETEISFLLCKDDVEVGVRTICSEPSDSTAPCEVFRPMIIPALAQNPHVGFLKNGFLLNGKAMEIRKKSDIAYFDALCHAADFDMPLVVVADSGTVQKKLDLEQLDVSAVPKLQSFSAELSAHNDMLHFYDRNVQMNEAESTVTKNLQQPLNRRVKRHVSSKMKLKPEAASPAKAETTEKLPVFPFEKLAEKLLGFGVVCFVEHRCLEEFSRKYKLALQEGTC